jgi:hypothetical protein
MQFHNDLVLNCESGDLLGRLPGSTPHRWSTPQFEYRDRNLVSCLDGRPGEVMVCPGRARADAPSYFLAKKSVTGIDVIESKVERINAGDSFVQDVAPVDVASLVEAGKFRATTDFSVIADLDTINICLPTPLRKTKDPDMSFIVSACQEIAKFVHPGLLAILESTT